MLCGDGSVRLCDNARFWRKMEEISAKTLGNGFFLVIFALKLWDSDPSEQEV